MTLEEAINLANSGDLDAVIALADYYADENKDIKEAIKWYEKGAIQGNIRCMYMTALYLVLWTGVKRIAAGYTCVPSLIEDLNKALYWYNKANKCDVSSTNMENLSDRLYAELGSTYYYYTIYCLDKENYDNKGKLKSNAKNALDKSIQYFDNVNNLYEITPEHEYIYALAISLLDFGTYDCTDEQRIIRFNLLVDLFENRFNDLSQPGEVTYKLGECYTLGLGCNKDYDKAVILFNKAQSLGYDCDDYLPKFRKKLFGGWIYKE